MLSRRTFLQGMATTAAVLSVEASAGTHPAVVHVPADAPAPLGNWLRERIAAAQPHKRLELIFPEGKYVIDDTPPSTEAQKRHPFDTELVLAGFENVVIRGEGAGATLLFSRFERGAFRFIHCDHVRIENIAIDWPRPPFSTGVVTASKGAELEIRIDDDFPTPARLAVTSMIRYEPDTGAPTPIPGAMMYYHLPPENTVFLASQRLRITLPEQREIPVGAVLSLQHAQYGGDGFHFWHCRKVQAVDCTVYTCPGMAFHGHSGHNITLTRCAVKPSNRQRRRFHSSTADGSHFLNYSGRVTLEECTFINTGDDCNNTWGTYCFVKERLDDHTLRISHQGTHFMYPQKLESGDTFEFIGQDLEVIAVQKAELVRIEEDNKSYWLRFKEKLPASVQPKTYLIDASRLPSLRIKNCHGKNTRGRGFLISTRDVIVEDCIFEHLQNGGILALPMLEPWFAAAGLDGLILRCNTFRNNNQGVGPCCGEIMVGAIHNGWTHGAIGVNKSIVIQDNTIENTGNLWLQLGSIDGAVVTGNTIRNSNIQKPYRPWMNAAVALVNTRNIHFEGNTVTWTRQDDPGFRFWDLQGGVDRDSLVLRNNTGFVPLPERGLSPP